MKSGSLTLVVLAASALLAHSAEGQDRPTLHVNTRWKQCSLQLDPALRQPAWRQFTREAGQLVYFRPLAGARPMGRGKFELSITQWQTNVDDNTSAWNDTFVHPDSLHWLYEGSGLQFPGLALRAGVGSRSDVGLYVTKNFQANYGAWGVQLQQSVFRGARGWDVAVRGSFVSLFGPEDVGLNVAGLDVVTSWKQWSFGPASLSPYAGVSGFLASSHERSARVALDDERVTGTMATLGAQLQVAAVRFAAEGSIARVPSFALKVGVAR